MRVTEDETLGPSQDLGFNPSTYLLEWAEWLNGFAEAYDENKSAKELQGVHLNRADDTVVVLSACATYASLSIVVTLVFHILQKKLPMVFAHRCREMNRSLESGGTGSSEQIEPPSILEAANIQDEEFLCAAGLDARMLVEFYRLGRQISGVAGFVLIVVLCPSHYALSPDAHHGAHINFLHRTGISGLTEERGKKHMEQLCWAHAIGVWLVILISLHYVARSHHLFLSMRRTWLNDLSLPRASSLLLTNLPKQLRSDHALARQFADTFGSDAVERVYVVRDARALKKKIDQAEALAAQVSVVEKKGVSCWQCVCGKKKDLVLEDLAQQLTKCRIAIKEEREMLLTPKIMIDDIQPIDDDRLDVAFVTFTSTETSEMALKSDKFTFSRELAPDPADVSYDSLASKLKIPLVHDVAFAFWLLIIFVMWSPFVVWLTGCLNITMLHRTFPRWMPRDGSMIDTILAGVLSAITVQFFIDLLPTILALIIDAVKVVKSGTEAQWLLQKWYFNFLVIFVLLVTAVLRTLITTLEQIIENPERAFDLLSENLPHASHFYYGYVMLAVLNIALDLLRVGTLFKYLFFRLLGDSVDDARKSAEPEDPDYFGQGGRMARASLILTVGIVFSSCSPLLLTLVYVYFCYGSWCYTYLSVYAEVKKPDSGGTFWMQAVWSIFLGLTIYVLLMVGVLRRTAEGTGPPVVALSSVTMMIAGYLKFTYAALEPVEQDRVVRRDIDRARDGEHMYIQKEFGSFCLT